MPRIRTFGHGVEVAAKAALAFFYRTAKAATVGGVSRLARQPIVNPFSWLGGAAHSGMAIAFSTSRRMSGQVWAPVYEETNYY